MTSGLLRFITLRCRNKAAASPVQLLHNRGELARDALFLKQSFPHFSFFAERKFFRHFQKKCFFFLPEPDMNYIPNTHTLQPADLLTCEKKGSLIPDGNSSQTCRYPLCLALQPSVPGRIGSERWKVSSFTYWRLRLCNDFPGELEQSEPA